MFVQWWPNLHFLTPPKIPRLVVFSPRRETRLWADITPLSTQPSCEDAANEVVTAKCNHHPALLLWNCSHITLIGVLGVLKLLHPALMENLLHSHHRWLMASIGCGFYSFTPQGTSWFSLLQAVRDKGLLSAPWTKRLYPSPSEVLTRRSHHYQMRPTSPVSLIFHCWITDLVTFPTESKFGFSFLHLGSKCFFPPKTNMLSVYLIIKKNCDLVAQSKKVYSHEKHRKRKTKRKKAR